MRINCLVFTMFVCFTVALASVGWCEEEDPIPENTSSGEYLVGAGDLIEIVVWKNPEVSGEFRIRPDGKFSMPLVGDIVYGRARGREAALGHPALHARSLGFVHPRTGERLHFEAPLPADLQQNGFLFGKDRS
jgi:hypothetical protein